MSSTESIDTVDELIKKFHLKTVETSKEIYFWDLVTGIYRPNGIGYDRQGIRSRVS